MTAVGAVLDRPLVWSTPPPARSRGGIRTEGVADLKAYECRLLDTLRGNPGEWLELGDQARPVGHYYKLKQYGAEVTCRTISPNVYRYWARWPKGDA